MENKVNLEYFTNRVAYSNSVKAKMKYSSNYELQCKFCGILYNRNVLKYRLTMKMIFETEVMIKHTGMTIDINFDRPDLQHKDSSMLYLPWKVCEKW